MIGPVSDDDWYKQHRAPTPPRQPTPGELLFEFHVPTTCTFWRVELRDHGSYGVEAQFLDPVDVRIARTFHPQMDPTGMPRAMAIAWAQQERKSVRHDRASGGEGDCRYEALYGERGRRLFLSRDIKTE